MGWCGMVSFRFPFKTLLATGLLSFVLVDYPPMKVRLATDGDMVKKAEFYPLSSFSASQPDKNLVFHEAVLIAGKNGVKKLDAAVTGL